MRHRSLGAGGVLGVSGFERSGNPDTNTYPAQASPVSAFPLHSNAETPKIRSWMLEVGRFR